MQGSTPSARPLGLPSLAVADDLVAVARRHSVRMADAADLHHNPDLATEVTGWQKVGENVGRGPRVEPIHDAFMNSPGHRENILDPDWTEIGIGVEVRDGTVWVTEVFREPEAAPAPGTAPPAPEPAAAPAPAPAPSRRHRPRRHPGPPDPGRDRRRRGRRPSRRPSPPRWPRPTTARSCCSPGSAAEDAALDAA